MVDAEGRRFDLVNHPDCENIDDLNRVVTEAGEDHAFALGIDRKVVEAALYPGQRYLLHLAHGRRLALLGMSEGAECGKHADSAYRADQDMTEMHR